MFFYNENKDRKGPLNLTYAGESFPVAAFLL